MVHEEASAAKVEATKVEASGSARKVFTGCACQKFKGASPIRCWHPARAFLRHAELWWMSFTPADCLRALTKG